MEDLYEDDFEGDIDYAEEPISAMPQPRPLASAAQNKVDVLQAASSNLMTPTEPPPPEAAHGENQSKGITTAEPGAAGRSDPMRMSIASVSSESSREGGAAAEGGAVRTGGGSPGGSGKSSLNSSSLTRKRMMPAAPSEAPSSALIPSSPPAVNVTLSSAGLSAVYSTPVKALPPKDDDTVDEGRRSLMFNPPSAPSDASATPRLVVAGKGSVGVMDDAPLLPPPAWSKASESASLPTPPTDSKSINKQQQQQPPQEDKQPPRIPSPELVAEATPRSEVGRPSAGDPTAASDSIMTFTQDIARAPQPSSQQTSASSSNPGPLKAPRGIDAPPASSQTRDRGSSAVVQQLAPPPSGGFFPPAAAGPQISEMGQPPLPTGSGLTWFPPGMPGLQGMPIGFPSGFPPSGMLPPGFPQGMPPGGFPPGFPQGMPPGGFPPGFPQGMPPGGFPQGLPPAFSMPQGPSPGSNMTFLQASLLQSAQQQQPAASGTRKAARMTRDTMSDADESDDDDAAAPGPRGGATAPVASAAAAVVAAEQPGGGGPRMDSRATIPPRVTEMPVDPNAPKVSDWVAS